MTRSLDLGCGKAPRNPFNADEVFGVDLPGPHIQGNPRIRGADLTIQPIPWDDASLDFVSAHDFIEHMPRLIYAPQRRYPFVALMEEIHRVLKPGGLFLSHTPAFPYAPAFRDPTHVNIITDETFPLYFCRPNNWASIYGFTGSFELISQAWNMPHLATVLRKTEAAA